MREFWSSEDRHQTAMSRFFHLRTARDTEPASDMAMASMSCFSEICDKYNSVKLAQMMAMEKHSTDARESHKTPLDYS